MRRTATDAAGVLGSTLADVRGFNFHTSRRTVYNTVDPYAVCEAIFVQNRVFCHTTCIRRPYYGASGRNIVILFGTEKLEWLGYPIW